MWSRRYRSTPQYFDLYKEIDIIVSDLVSKNIFLIPTDMDDLLEKILDKKGISLDSFKDSKTYLYEMLLKSLRDQHEEASKEYIIKKNLQEAKVLEWRGMPDAAIEKYKLALKDAKKYHAHTYAIDILKNYIMLSTQFSSKNYVEDINALINEYEQEILFAKQEAAIFSLYSQAFTLVRTQKNFIDDPRKDQISKLSKGLEKIGDVPNRFFSQIFWHSTKASLSVLEKDSKSAHKYYLLIVKIWEQEENKHLKEEYLRSFIIFLGNCLTYCVSNKDHGSFDKYLEVLRDIKPKNFDDEAEHFQSLVYVRQFNYLNQGKLDEAIQLTNEIEKGLAKFGSKINKARVRTLRFNMMLANFGLEKYDQALSHLAPLIEKSSHREDIGTVAKLFELIIQYKLQNHDNLDTRVRSLSENLKYSENLHDFERTVLKHMSKLIKIQQTFAHAHKKQAIETQTAFEVFYNDLITLKSEGNFLKPTGFDAIMLWVRSNKERISFQDLLK